MASDLYQTVIVCFASYLVWFWLLQRYLASRMGVMSLLSPAIAVILGAILLSEPLTPGFLVAAAMIIAGLVIVMSRDRDRQTVMIGTGLDTQVMPEIVSRRMLHKPGPVATCRRYPHLDPGIVTHRAPRKVAGPHQARQNAFACIGTPFLR